jgi:phosphoserine phosphatase SerB
MPSSLSTGSKLNQISQAIPFAELSPVALVQAYQGCCQLSWQQGQFNAVSQAAKPELPVLLCFGAHFSWSLLTTLAQALALPDGVVKLSLLQPVPQLSPALRLHLPDGMVPPQALLNRLALDYDCQLVYLRQQPSLRQPGLLVMDMDSTAIEIECIDEIAKLAGVGEQVAAITARAMNGELDFAQSLLARVQTLAGAPESVLSDVLQQLPLMPGLTDLVAVLQQHQWQVAIASGGFTYFTEALKQRLQLSATFANQLEIVDGTLTGRVLGNIVDAKRKAEVVHELAQRYQITPSQTVAIGDGANDLPMLAEAALGVAFHAKPKVQAAAKAAITTGSLLQLLYLLDCP